MSPSVHGNEKMHNILHKDKKNLPLSRKQFQLLPVVLLSENEKLIAVGTKELLTAKVWAPVTELFQQVLLEAEVGRSDNQRCF